MLAMASSKDSSKSSPAKSEKFVESKRLCYVPVQEITENPDLFEELYPEIDINWEMFHRQHVMPGSGAPLMRITEIFVEKGLVEAIEEAAYPYNATYIPITNFLATYALRVCLLVRRIKELLQPFSKRLSVETIAKYSETRDWVQSYIRCIKWHPNYFIIAVASRDDCIRIYTEQSSVIHILKDGNQNCITSMAWRPSSTNSVELAVGCQLGILLWSMKHDPYSILTKPKSQLLKHPNRYPITSVEWSPGGCFLATCSINDTDILIWDLDEKKHTPLRRMGLPSSILKWSPDFTRLLSSTTGNIYRVWITDEFLPKEWTTNSGTIQSAAWSPCGNFLLFVTTVESMLYELRFTDEQTDMASSLSKEATPIADLSKTEVGIRAVGGIPHSIVWDQSGKYLAIIFKDSACVVIFSTSIHQCQLSISPFGFITGGRAEFPSYICFQSKNEQNTRNVLTIGWSSGRIQYFHFDNL